MGHDLVGTNAAQWKRLCQGFKGKKYSLQEEDFLSLNPQGLTFTKSLQRAYFALRGHEPLSFGVRFFIRYQAIFQGCFQRVGSQSRGGRAMAYKRQICVRIPLVGMASYRHLYAVASRNTSWHKGERGASPGFLSVPGSSSRQTNGMAGCAG